VNGGGLSLLPDGHWKADFTDDSALISGNLSGLDPVTDGQIDVTDFAILASQWNQTVGKDTGCLTPAPHSDLSGDGFVNTIDLAHLSPHDPFGFGAISQPRCCMMREALGDFEIQSEVSVKELCKRGMCYLRVVDVDHDGWITMDDVFEYMRLQEQEPPEPQGPPGPASAVPHLSKDKVE
jgi:hypothetical protein